MNGQTASLLTFFVLSSLPGAMLVYTAYSPTTGYSFVVFEDSVDDTDSWFEARAKCRVHSQYADLAEISASDFTIVQDLLSNSQASSSSYWIGIYDHLSEMNFKSLYTGADITFANWDNGRPKNDMNKNCGSWDTSNSYWKDEACTGKKRGVLCRMLTPIPSSNIDPNTGCPPTMVPFDDVCYDFRVLMTGNFSSARQACETLPGRMIIPESQSEADFVDLYTILTGKATFWLGITDEEEDNDLRSIYGPNLSFEKWHPSGSGVVASETDCAYIDTSSGYWLTDHCDEPKGVMCSFVPPLLQEETTVAQSITSTSETTQDAFTIVASTDHDVTSPTSSEAQGPLICSENPLGMESSAIPDAMVSASTSDSSHSAANARLNHNSAGWKSRSYDKDPWIQVAFQGAALLGMLSTQAPDQLDPPPEGTLFEFQLLAKGDAGEWMRYPLVLSANYEAGGEIVDFTFERSLRVTVLRLYIVTTPLIGLRMELYGCYENLDTECAVDADCDAASTCIDTYCACALSVSSLLFGSSPTCSECWSPLGLESGKIIDSQISASTSRSTGPHTNARIGNAGAWSPEDSDTSPWLMVQFNETTRVTGMRTKGEVIYILGFPNRDFVRKAKIEYGIMGNNYPIEENGEPKIFTLNNDENEVVTNIFPCPVETDFIKLIVVSPEASKVGLRLELLGCDLQTTTSPGTCTVDADCQQGPMHNCVQQRCLLVIPTTESWSTLETTSVRQTTEIVPTTEQATTDAPTTMMAQTTTEPVTTGKIVSPSEPTTEASTTTDAETTVEPTTISLPTDVTSTEAAEPSTAQPTSLASTTRTDVLSTARYTTFLMTSVDSSNTPVCLPGDVVTATGPSVNTEGVYDETVPSHSEEFLDALRREADIEGLGEQDTASLCSALAGSGGGISQGVTHVGLKVLMQVTANKTKPILSQDLVASVRFLDTVANSDWDSADANNSRATLEKMVNVGSNLLNSGNEKPWKDSQVKHTLSGPIQIVNSLEKMALKVGAKLEKESSVEVTSENIDIDLYGVSSDDLLLSGWKWNSSDAKFMAAITAQEFQMKNFSAYERALLVGGVFRNIAALSSSDIPSNDMAMSSENGQRLQSDIVTVMASGMDTISVSVSYSTPKNLGDVVIKEHEVPEFSCAFWEFNDSSTPGSGRWSDLGCYVLKSDEENSDDEVSCFCNHTTNFAVLMQVVDKPVPAEPDIHSHVLQILTYTCLTLSIISLLVSLAVFLYLGSSLASERLTIHKNLMLAMLLATVLFLLGVASNLDVIPCKIVAILLHYLFLAVFCWTLVEGIHLYRQVIAVFEQGGSKLALYYVAGWGVPAVVVGISLGIKYNLYGAGPHCWLTAKDGLIWAFVGPVIFIITVNMIVLIMVVVVVTRAAALKCQTNLDRIRAACKSAMMLVPLLGISWIIGLFTQYSMALEYAFVILNGLQGFFMFVFYCLLSSEVRTALRHEMKKRADRNMDSSGNVVKTNIWTLSSNKTAHIRLVKVAPSAQNSDEA